jgi:hypothetical protein
MVKKIIRERFAQPNHLSVEEEIKSKLHKKT